MKDRTPGIRRGLMDVIDPRDRLIAIRGGRGVGKTRFLLDFCGEHYPEDPAALYVNISNLFLAREGLYSFIERFYKLGGKVLLLDQLHEYPEWDEEIRAAYDRFTSVQFVFTISSLFNVETSAYLQGVARVYDLNGLSFREFIELESGHHFPTFAFQQIIESHEEIAREIAEQVRPLAYIRNYLHYGYYPLYLEKKSPTDYLLRNISQTLDFDIPYLNQIDLKYLWKLKELLYMVAIERYHNVNISKLSHGVGISRATVLNYLHYLKDARLLTLLFDREDDIENGLKPNQFYIHNPNLLRTICLENASASAIRKSFFVSQVSAVARLNFAMNGDFLVDGIHEVSVHAEGDKVHPKDLTIQLVDMVERGSEKAIPLWLTGFLY
ncbi:MAG: AAA family ATPase [Odoribacteraceae bacterium]|nr:AAA family ATPase [Odoribacteraceae bacterium]